MSFSTCPQQIKMPDTTELSVSSSSPSLSTQNEKQIPSSSPSSNDLESQPPPPAPVYHVFSRTQKLCMVYIVSLAAIFSPLSSNIYFPALGLISKSLDISMSLITLTVTIYMIVQGLAPSFWGSFSDVIGRRTIFVGTFLVYIISNIALALSKNYGQLMAFRALQAAGSAATISIGAGVIGDIASSAERGGLVGIFGGVRMLGQGIGPVFGGVLSEYLGFRSIFWFLAILSTLSLLTILFFLPETLRSIAGDGTVPLHGIHKPWIYLITGQRLARQDAVARDSTKRKITVKTVVAPLGFLGEKDVFVTLFFGAVVYSVWSMVTSSTSDLFESTYGLNTLEVGLTFLGNGFGCMSGSYTIGYLMDYNHRRTERDYCVRSDLPVETRITTKSHPDFPIEYARMRNTWWITAVFIICTATYGFSLRTHLAVPVILQYIIAYCATAIFTINSTLIIDLYPGASASATAVNNLMRCLVGAGGVAAIQPMIDALTAQWAFLLLAGTTLLMCPLLVVEMRWGAGWRQNRLKRLEREQEAAQQRSAQPI
ncbi:hypothetical protein N7539_000577 [Penicillium diatomitis]|uniref:Major facilitator superfamily (MFS) profile domain-containing protein n=1 Tax=Penicillium diatomitis TaxID=2819901 RepID=A0A9X0C2G8_9EURO|nr:uncharacterized protein N7539_000577 [Penicillium diatomitis]KAJ5495461.1 hypothetical protein N7539_000577 [Penicillium diatomitis]